MDDKVRILSEICEDPETKNPENIFDLIDSIRAKACYLDELGYSDEALESFNTAEIVFNRISNELLFKR